MFTSNAWFGIPAATLPLISLNSNKSLSVSLTPGFSAGNWRKKATHSPLVTPHTRRHEWGVVGVSLNPALKRGINGE